MYVRKGLGCYTFGRGGVVTTASCTAVWHAKGYQPASLIDKVAAAVCRCHCVCLIRLLIIVVCTTAHVAVAAGTSSVSSSLLCVAHCMLAAQCGFGIRSKICLLQVVCPVHWLQQVLLMHVRISCRGWRRFGGIWKHARADLLPQMLAALRCRHASIGVSP